jgi:hypothetical protein
MTYPLPDGSDHFHRNMLNHDQFRHIILLLGGNYDELAKKDIETLWLSWYRITKAAHALHPNKSPFSTPHAGNYWGEKFKVKHFGHYRRKYKKFTMMKEPNR